MDKGWKHPNTHALGIGIDRIAQKPDLVCAMNKKVSTKKKPLEYPDETNGSKMAAVIRQQANRLTAGQRAELFKEGMVTIYGGQWPKKATRAGH